ncbi:hypothetical protein FQR65_LT14921 [Abscondita terminalis]|nr:hypothetical protein FQR65_LT14921 [Abscondita terminalis]
MESQTRKREHGNQNMEKSEYGNDERGNLNIEVRGLPNDVTLYWHQYPWILGESFCKIRALISEMATYVSVLTIVAFSTERYLAICYPLHLHTMSGFQRALWIIGCLWIIALLSATPFSIYSTVDYLTYPPDSDNILEESAFCAMMSQPESLPLAELSFLLFFLIPMIIIGVQYTRMALKISKQTEKLGKGLHGSVHRGSGRRNQSHKAVIRMLLAVVIGFFLCWAPFHAQRLLFIYGQEFTYYYELNAWMFYITGILYYLSSTLNPILYNVMSNRYRSAFKEILCGIKSKHKLLRSSTFRETRRLSHSENIKFATHPDIIKHSHKQIIRGAVVDETILEESTFDTNLMHDSCSTSVNQPKGHEISEICI